MLLAIARLRWIIRCLLAYGIGIAGFILTLEIWTYPNLIMSLPGSTHLVSRTAPNHYQLWSCPVEWFVPVAAIVIMWLFWPGRWSATRRRPRPSKIEEIINQAPFEVYASPVGSFSDTCGFQAAAVLTKILADTGIRAKADANNGLSDLHPAADVAPAHQSQRITGYPGPLGYQPTLAYAHGTNLPDPSLVAVAAAAGNIHAYAPPAPSVPTSPTDYLDHIPRQARAEQLVHQT
jgi:hypothetical protein